LREKTGREVTRPKYSACRPPPKHELGKHARATEGGRPYKDRHGRPYRIVRATEGGRPYYLTITPTVPTLAPDRRISTKYRPAGTRANENVPTLPFAVLNDDTVLPRRSIRRN
jgi:hypothetical protein